MTSAVPQDPALPPPRPHGSGGAGLDLPEFLALLYRERVLALGVFISVLALFVAYALTATPIYRAYALLRVERRSAALGGTGSLIGALFAGASSTQAEVDILRSRAVLFPAIRRLGLDVAITAPGGRRYDALESRIGHRVLEIVRWHVPSAWRGRRLRLVRTARGFLLETRGGQRLLAGRPGVRAANPEGFVVEIRRFAARPGTAYTVVRRPVEDVEGGVLGALSVFEDGVRTGIIEAAMEGPHPRWLARVLNAVDREFLAENVAAHARRARESLLFIDRELPRLRRRLDRATARFDRFRSRHRIVALSDETRALFAELSRLEETLTVLRLRLAELRESYRSRFPLVRGLLREKTRIEALRTRLLAHLRSLPLEEQEYLRLKREAVIAGGLYVSLLKKAQELRVEEAGTVGNVRLVEPAIVPDRPVKPDRRVIVALGKV